MLRKTHYCHTRTTSSFLFTNLIFFKKKNNKTKIKKNQRNAKMCDADECCVADIGFQGDMGVQGFSSFGFQGDTGSQADAIIGSQGIQGFPGNIFYGYQGDPGLQGSSQIGQQGLDGAQGYTVQGPQGYDGANGAHGAQGSLNVDSVTQGVQGISEPGLQGAQGIVGFGSIGPQGPIGSTGPSNFFGISQIPVTLQANLAITTVPTTIMSFAVGVSGTYVVYVGGTFQSNTPTVATFTLGIPASNTQFIYVDTPQLNQRQPFNLQMRTVLTAPTSIAVQAASSANSNFAIDATMFVFQY